jgi:hypothetical protein
VQHSLSEALSCCRSGVLLSIGCVCVCIHTEYRQSRRLTVCVFMWCYLMPLWWAGVRHLSCCRSGVCVVGVVLVYAACWAQLPVPTRDMSSLSPSDRWLRFQGGICFRDAVVCVFLKTPVAASEASCGPRMCARALTGVG